MASSRPKKPGSTKPVSPAAKHAPAVPASDCIRLFGVRQNNLKGFDLSLPLLKFIVITGLSGSGKSSLAFETLYAEGQRRYIETFTPYARQFFDRMDKPAVDRIENIPPAIAIEQRNAVRTTRSTVGTMTEICDHLKLVWSHFAQLHCRQCQQPVRRESPQDVWNATAGAGSVTSQPEALITFDLALTDKLPIAEQLGLLAKQGFQRLLIGEDFVRTEEAAARFSTQPSVVTVICDRIRLAPENRSRFVEACETAYQFAHGKLHVRKLSSSDRTKSAGKVTIEPPVAHSSGYHCARCDLEYKEPTPSLFSFNNPVGACSHCKGFGRIITIDPDLALPDRSKSLYQGVVRPWQTGMSAECQEDLMKAAKRHGVPLNVPFNQLSHEHQRWVMDGEPGYGVDGLEWPKAWYGVKGYFRWLESKAYKMHVRVLLSRYRSYRTCPECHGNRFNADSLLYRLHDPAHESNAASSITLSAFYQLPIGDAYQTIRRLSERRTAPNDPLVTVLREVETRLGYLNQIGLGYLTLDRPTRTLSGGETERVNLTSCLGTRLVNALFVLDEPSVGLHPRDTDRLIDILQNLRSAGNTVVVVEHEASVIRAADQLVDIGPGHGITGGEVVFQGAPTDLVHARNSLTADYLIGRRSIPVPKRRTVPLAAPTSGGLPGWLKLSNASANNLRDVTVDIPLRRFVAVTGVSGSGKSTLIRDVLLPLLQAKLDSTNLPLSLPEEDSDEGGDSQDSATDAVSVSATLSGFEALASVVLVDQTSLGRTPRSNPAVYIGAFDEIRDVFAASEGAKSRGYLSNAFSFNSKIGQCERCRGAGFEKIEMQFLSDIFIRCPVCQGRRYREPILEVKVDGTGVNGSPAKWSIADLLDATIEDAITFLAGIPNSKAAARAVGKLKLLVEVGLGYLKVGQPINTLSGGESQRLKLVSHLAETQANQFKSRVDTPAAARHLVAHLKKNAPPPPRHSLFLFDEPTTGLHFDDVRVLLAVFQRLVDAGHTVLVIEHNIDVIKSCDWVIDLGPDAGDSGGQVVVSGPPEVVAACRESHTGRYLAGVLK
jgi:excinuclease ABC subunit A